MKSNKGSAFERDIARKLSLWWTNDERDDVFWRTSQSGGRASVRAKKGQKTHGSYGDIAAVDPIGEPLIQTVTIELKRGYKKWSFLDIVDKSPKAALQTFEKFWEQVKEDSKNAGTPYSMIIFKRDRREPCVVIERDIRSLQNNSHLGSPPIMMISFLEDPLYVISLDSFFKCFSPNIFHKIYKKTHE